jgi:hypothetical protein
MKRCPACKRVETDDALVFCRADGTALVRDSSPLSGEAGTAGLGSTSAATEIETSFLPHTTDAVMSRGTAPTAMLPAPPVTTSSLAKPKRRRLVIALIALAAMGVS